jgi:hypothetical protein
MIKNNKKDEKEELLSIDDKIISIISNENKKEQEKDYQSINNLADYKRKYAISNVQAQKMLQERGFDPIKRKAILRKKNNNETNKKINQEETNNNKVLNNNHIMFKNKRSDKKLKDVKDNQLMDKRKYILKYLLLKKEKKLNKILKISFEKYKQKTISIIINIIDQQRYNYFSLLKVKNEVNIEELRKKKLRALVRKKMSKERDKLHLIFIKYYYASLYIHLNWYIYVINQLSYCQNIPYRASYIGTKNNTTNNNKEDHDPLKDFKPVEETNKMNTHNAEVNDALRQSLLSIAKMNNSDNIDEAFRESIRSINRINDALSKEDRERQNLEKLKHLKELVLKVIRERKNEFHSKFTKFYYQGRLIQKDNNENEVEDDNSITKLKGKRYQTPNPTIDRRNRGRSLRKMMVKKEKEKIDKLRTYFNKFQTSGMICVLKKNVKSSRFKKNAQSNKDEKEFNKDDLDEKKEELTLLDKKRIEDDKKRIELKQKITQSLKIIFYKKDRQITLIKRQTIEKWNLRAKIMSLDSMKKKQKFAMTKSIRFKKKTKNMKSDKKYPRSSKSIIKLKLDNKVQENKNPEK